LTNVPRNIGIDPDAIAQTLADLSANRRPFRDASDFKREDAFRQLLRWNGNDFRHPSTLQRFSMAD
jgi:hypothetical protein